MKLSLNEFLYKLDIIAPLISILYIAALSITRKVKLIFSDKVLLSFIVLQLILNFISGYLHFNLINNLWAYHLNYFISHLIFTIYFGYSLPKKWIVYVGFCISLIISILTFFTIQPYDQFPSYASSFSYFILVVYALLLLNTIIDSIPTFHILSLKDFWLITGALTYFGSTFFIYISYNYLSEILKTDPNVGKDIHVLWQVQNVFLSVSCIIFLKAITSRQWILK